VVSGCKHTKSRMNSINILLRQRGECYFDGNEDFDSRGIKSNMDQLSFRTDHDDMSNEINHGDHRSDGILASLHRAEIDNGDHRSDSTQASLHRALLVMCVLPSLICQVIVKSSQNAAGADSPEANTQ